MTLGSMPAGEEAGLGSVFFYRYSTFFLARGVRVVAGRRVNTRAYKDFFRRLPHQPVFGIWRERTHRLKRWATAPAALPSPESGPSRAVDRGDSPVGSGPWLRAGRPRGV